MTPPDFLSVAETALTAMEQRARTMGLIGAAVVVWADLEPARAWTSALRIVGSMTKGTSNLVGIAYTKAAEMADTLRDSGSGIRPPLTGEYGYRGGLIKKCGTGHVMAVFSGATGEQDVEISQTAIQVFAQHYR